MTINRVIVQGFVGQLPADKAQEVQECKAKIKEVVNASGLYGLLALSLVLSEAEENQVKLDHLNHD